MANYSGFGSSKGLADFTARGQGRLSDRAALSVKFVCSAEIRDRAR